MKFSPTYLSFVAVKFKIMPVLIVSVVFVLVLAPAAALASYDVVPPPPASEGSKITQFTTTVEYEQSGMQSIPIITIVWAATNSTYCTLNGQQLQSVSGTLNIHPPTDIGGNTTYTFNLHCVNSSTNTTSDAISTATASVINGLFGVVAPPVAGFSQACGPVSSYSSNTSSSSHYPTNQELVRTPACISFCSSVASSFNYQRCSSSSIPCTQQESWGNPACTCSTQGSSNGGKGGNERICAKPGPAFCEIVQSEKSAQNLCRDFGVYWPAVSYASLVQKSYSLIPIGNYCNGGQCSTDSYGMSRDQLFSFMLNNGGAASTLANDPKSGTVNYLCKTYGGTNITPEGFARGTKTSGRSCFYVGLGNPQSGKQAAPGWSCDPSCDSCGGGVATAMCSKPADTMPPSVTISANPNPVMEGAGSNITWHSTNAVSCTSSDFWTGGGAHGVVPVTPTFNKYRFSISCTSASGITATNYVNIGLLRPISSVSCTTASPTANTGTSVSWSATVSGGQTPYAYAWTGTDGLSGSAGTVSKIYLTPGVKTAAVTVTDVNGSTKTVNCANTSTVSVAVPTATLKAEPSSIILGGTSLLTWGSTNATSCTGSGFSTGGATSGTKLVGPSTDTNYAVTCTNANTSATASKAIMVTVRQPSASISSSTGRAKKGDTVTISWNAQNVTSCTISGTGIGTTGTKTQSAVGGSLSGSQDVVIQAQSTYIISCSPSGQSSQSAATVNLAPDFQEF